MIMQRRSFLTGVLGLVAAPAVIRTPHLLMPIKGIIHPTDVIGYESYSEQSENGIRYRFRAKQANGVHRPVNFSDIPEKDRMTVKPVMPVGFSGRFDTRDASGPAWDFDLIRMNDRLDKLT